MEPTDPAVKAFVDAVNAGDASAVRQALAQDFTMSDDGIDRDGRQWVEQNLIASHARLQVNQEENAGKRLFIGIDDEKWGHMETYWDFQVRDGTIARFETGQASAL